MATTAIELIYSRFGKHHTSWLASFVALIDRSISSFNTTCSTSSSFANHQQARINGWLIHRLGGVAFVSDRSISQQYIPKAKKEDMRGETNV